MRVSYVAVALLLSASTTAAQEFCNWRPRQIDNPADIRATTLVLKTSRETLGIYNNCVTIVRRQFGNILSFALVNRFPEEIGMTSAYALVKSTRTLSTSPPIKVSLSRGKGWLFAGATSASPVTQREMSFEPFKGTVEQWNSAHASAATPEEFANRLKTSWHAYIAPDFGISSGDAFQFWQVAPTFNPAHDVSTHYLLRFDVNIDKRVSLVPFTVHLQPEVQQIILEVYSNIDSLSGEYRFIVR